MDNMDYDLYVMAELKYIKSHKELKEEELFPQDWYKSENYKLKIDIIVEALKKNKMINETELYLTKFVEKTK